MSFFDEDDEPRTRVRSREAAGGGSADRQTLLVRQLVLFGGVAVVLILLVLLVRSCQGNAKRDGLRDYNQRVAALVGESDSQVSQGFFDLMRDPSSQDAGNLQDAILQYRVQAEQQYEQAQAIDTPDEMQAAQRAFLETMEFRRDGLTSIAERVRSALSDDEETSTEAIGQIAGAMQMFLASDVIYQARVYPLIDDALKENDVGGQRIQRSRFLPGIEWLQTDTIADSLGAPAGGGAGGEGDQEPAPGLHGTGLNSVAIGNTTLQPDAANRITLTGDTNVAVTFTNQGENDETNVRVVVRIGDIRRTRTVPAVAVGATATASVAIDEVPPIGTPVTIRVEVEPVPGEEKTDNNSAEYEALFSQG